jgi:hypothetical protein
MDDKTKLILVAVVLLVVGFPILANLMGEKKAEQPAAPAPAGNNADPAPKVALPPAPAPQPEQQFIQQPMMPPPPPPRPMGPPPPINVANTSWTISHPQAGNVTVQFFANGTALAQSDKFPMQVEGSWQQNGSNVNLTSPMGSITAQIKGDQLIAMGNAARRLR